MGVVFPMIPPLVRGATIIDLKVRIGNNVVEFPMIPPLVRGATY